jgi:hypothetical protein
LLHKVNECKVNLMQEQRECGEIFLLDIVRNCFMNRVAKKQAVPEVICINTASRKQLVTLQGIGEATACKIIGIRDQQPGKRFASVDHAAYLCGLTGARKTTLLQNTVVDPADARQGNGCIRTAPSVHITDIVAVSQYVQELQRMSQDSSIQPWQKMGIGGRFSKCTKNPASGKCMFPIQILHIC